MKINISHKNQALIESWMFAGLAADGGYLATKAFDALSKHPAHVNWVIVGYLFLSGALAPILRALVAKYPKLSPFANRLIAVVDGRAGIPVTTITSPAPVEVTTVTVPVETAPAPTVPAEASPPTP